MQCVAAPNDYLDKNVAADKHNPGFVVYTALNLLTFTTHLTIKHPLLSQQGDWTDWKFGTTSLYGTNYYTNFLPKIDT